MNLLFRAFRQAIPLDSQIHRKIRVVLPDNYLFMRDVEIVPLTYSEILAATMYYPVMFGIQEKEIFPFAVLGVQGKNIFVTDDGKWKVDVIPNVCKHYPFGVVKEQDSYTIVFDSFYESEQGERLFDDEGNDTEFFSKIKNGLTELARDFHDVQEFSKELFQSGLLQSLNLDVNTKYGSMEFRNMFIANLETLSKLQPEKLYNLNVKGTLLILNAHYLSLRNFKLFDIF